MGHHTPRPLSPKGEYDRFAKAYAAWRKRKRWRRPGLSVRAAKPATGCRMLLATGPKGGEGVFIPGGAREVYTGGARSRIFFNERWLRLGGDCQYCLHKALTGAYLASGIRYWSGFHGASPGVM